MSYKKDIKRWYVLNSRKNSVAIEEQLKMDGIESFVPMRYEKKERGGKVERVYTPAIPGFVFAREQRSVLADFIKEMWAMHGMKVYFAREHASGHDVGAATKLTARQAFQNLDPLIVPDKQMEDFIFICQQDEDKIRFLQPNEISLIPGDRIRIHGGLFDGREGELIEVKGMKKKQLVVRISDMLAVAAVNIEPKLIEVVE
ncbi:MAG: UpxY family transcription antiterminator, partial [Bacteroidaceae bacterium]|nr:UpxY family transcription antiterminator [Bacteroidaceae bacterium]